MAIYAVIGPCLCGATDCRKCFPGRVQSPECQGCGEELVEENTLDLDDERCLRCKGWAECPVCKKLAHPDDGFAETCGHPNAGET